MKLENIQRKPANKTSFISARVKPENAKWFKTMKVDMDLLIEELRKEQLSSKTEKLTQ